MTTKTGATSQNDEEQLTTEQQTAEDTKKQKAVNPRDAIFASLDEKRVAALEADGQYALNSGHPMAVQVEAERRASANVSAEEESAGVKTAAGEQEAGTSDQDTSDEGATDLEADPLADFIVEQGGKAMMKLKVDGKERLVPLETARAQLQKAEAAEVRLHQAAEQRKQLDARALQIQHTEASLAAREAKLRQSPTPPVAIDDQSLQMEAKALVSSLLTDSEDVAAEKLAKVLARTRQAPAPSIDQDAIVNKAVQVAEQRTAARETERNIKTGFDQFKTDYSDIAGDEGLFKLADSKTDSIQADHPEWTPAQVMLEAGRQTREWVQTLRGAPTPSATNDRQTRKDNLRPMPPARTARLAPRQASATVETPHSVVEEMRKARGQAT